MGYIAPVTFYQYQDYHTRTLARQERYDAIPISKIDKVSLLTPFRQILKDKQETILEIKRKKTQQYSISTHKAVNLEEFTSKHIGRHFNEYV